MNNTNYYTQARLSEEDEAFLKDMLECYLDRIIYIKFIGSREEGENMAIFIQYKESDDCIGYTKTPHFDGSKMFKNIALNQKYSLVKVW